MQAVSRSVMYLYFLDMKSECCCIPAEFIFQISNICVFVNIYCFDTHCGCPVTHLFCSQVIAESCVMSSAGQYPCLGSCLQVGLWCPESCSYWKFRHWFLYFLAVYIINDQAESVSQVDQGSSHCFACLRSK